MSFVDFKVLINKALLSWLGKWGKSSVDPGPGDERHLPFHDPESSSASPATLQVNWVRMRNLGNVGCWQQQLMSLPWPYLHVRPLIFSFGMLWFPICAAQCLRQAGRSLGRFPLAGRFPLQLAFSTAKCLGLMNQHFPMEKHSFGEFPVSTKPGSSTLQNPSRTGFILCRCTYKQFYCSLVSLYYNKIITQIQNHR